MPPKRTRPGRAEGGSITSGPFRSCGMLTPDDSGVVAANAYRLGSLPQVRGASGGSQMRAVRRATVHAVWAVIALSAFAGVALASIPTHASAEVTLDREEQAALDQLNVERTSRGLNALKVSPTLQAASEWMANDMVGNSTPTSLSHTDSLGRDIRPRFTSFGYTPNSSIRENIAAGQATGREVVQGWMDSPPHRVNSRPPTRPSWGSPSLCDRAPRSSITGRWPSVPWTTASW
ncbi:MAG: CAP domain-containing protein [Chloroflexi bacterium]|nr:CAP domain-containing protein [Chloroflexota bacterium]